MRRFALLILAIIIVIAAWSGLWLWGANQVRSEIEALATGSEFTFTCGRLDIGGYPFRIDVTCTEASVARLDFTASSPEIKATARIYRPGHVIAFAQPPLMLTDAFFATERRLDFDSAEASLRISGWSLDALALQRLSVRLENAALHDLLIGDTTLLTLGSAELHLLDAAEAGLEGEALAVFASAQALDYPEADIAGANLQSSVILTDLPTRLTAWAEPALVADWIAGDGTVDVEAFDFTSEEIDLSLSGAAQLDAEGRLNGTVDTKSRGIAERIDFNIMGIPAAQLMGPPDGNGQRSASFAIQRGQVFIPGLPVPLAEIAPFAGF